MDYNIPTFQSGLKIMTDRLNKEELENIRKKAEVCDKVVYMVGTALFEEDAGKDMKELIREIEICWKEIERLNDIVKLLSKKNVSLSTKLSADKKK